jgi:UDP-N-acetylglucosamine diphosphorylase / glucose-1-phosphate thymidylyltransferase / UDP-N-acetylgalactosamine diphosphorylase / glucosamine-1-phosphate N-acetyltransferase / galactosamine-1-phosphate N-acetyltransferase
MKALVLAAGRGKRLKEITEPSNKCMLKFNGTPLIEYSLNTAFLSQVDEVIIVVGYRAEEVINSFGIAYRGIKIRYVFQEQQKGLVHALEQAQSALDGDDFILLLADELLIDPKPLEMISAFYKEELFVACGVTNETRREQIQKTYSVIYNPDNNYIYRLIEKPRNPFNNIMGTGHCIFRNKIFDFIPYTPINHFRKEKELPDLIQCTIDDGKSVKMFFISAKYVNINTPEDIELAERMLESTHG